MMKLIKKIIAVFSVTLLIACKEEDLSNFYKNTENSITSAIYNIKNYSFKESWYRLKTAYNLVNRNRYYENQYIEIETSRNTQVAGFQSILTECQTFSCNILKQKLNKNLIFPENIIGKIELDINTTDAPTFITNLNKYGNIVKNEYQKDEYIERDLTLFYNDLIPLRSAFLKVNELLGKSDIYSPERLQELQEYAEKLNKQISILEDDIKYLTNLKDKRHITIKIERGYNSTFSLVKAKIQNIYIYIVEYMHILVILGILYLSIKLLKKIIFLLKKQKEKKENNNKIQNEDPKFEIPPDL